MSSEVGVRASVDGLRDVVETTTGSRFVAPIDGRDACSSIGGKALWLNRLVRAGFHIPPSVVITTDAYDAVVTDRRLAHFLSELPPPDLAGSGADRRQRVDEAFLAVELPEEVKRELAVAFDSVGAARGGLVAVRSSATAEDLHGTSFAGQYESFLNVDRSGFERKVRLVWASLWHPSPRWYRAVNGIGDEGIGMAAIVMAMVDADRAGVGFSIDPHDPEMRRIEIVRGLGDKLVGGDVTPDVHQVPRHTQPLSSEPDVSRVVTMLDEIEEAFGEPQDIEWAIERGELFVLQARPITFTLPADGDGFDSSTTRDTNWTTAGIAEMLPAALPPLIWTCNRRLLEEAFRSMYDEMGTLPEDIDEVGSFVGRFRCRAALNLDLMKAVSGSGADAQVEQQYFGVERPVGNRARWSPRRSFDAWRHNMALDRVRRIATSDAEVCIRATTEVVAEPLGLDRGTEELHAYRARLMDLAGRSLAAEVAVASAASAGFRRLELTIAKHLEAEKATSHALRLTSPAGGEDRISSVDGASSRSIFAGATWEESRGSAGVSSDSASTTDEHDALASNATVDVDAWLGLVEELRSRPSWGSTRMLTGQVVDLRLAVLRRLAEDANELFDRRERTKRCFLRLGGEVRRIHLELGRRLASAGALETPEDVDYLSERELTGVDPLPTRLEVGRRRRWLAGTEDDPLPLRFTGTPEHVQQRESTDDVVEGWAASPGRHRGRAVVLHDADETGLHPGDVLVARTTDAAWGPTFARAGAIVVEEGGPLSHAAIVARELGLPAVLNVPGVVGRVEASRDLQITVDGNQGLVIFTQDGTP